MSKRRVLCRCPGMQECQQRVKNETPSWRWER
jgi:hypothetical protein